MAYTTLELWWHSADKQQINTNLTDTCFFFAIDF
jgi:hypothetical protein